MDKDKRPSKVESSNQPEHPHSLEDFRQSIQWRIFRIMAEFVEGFQFLADFQKTITFFGSTRLDESSRWYQAARQLGTKLAERGFTVVTGGGPGIMEAANRGATEAGGPSIGLNIQLPHEQRTNPYVKRGIGFSHFFSRKVMLTYSAQVFVYFPGGFGTLDEFFEILTLVQTKKIAPVPLVLFGREYWEPLLNWFQTDLLNKYGTISKEDLALYQVVETVEEALETIMKTHARQNLF